MNWRDRPGMDGPTKQKTVMVDVECLVDPPKPTFRIRGVAQRLGDRGRVPYRDAQDLERRGKAKIIWGTEELELV